MEYRLDLDTLLLMLGQRTGHLYSKFQRLSGVKGRCQVFLHLEKGAIKSCTITDERGNQLASGEFAIKTLQNQVLEWLYEDEEVSTQRPDPPRLPSQTTPLRTVQTGPLRNLPAPLYSSPVPRRTYPVAQNEFMHWPRLYRSVYSLIDGNVSVEYIVRLLAREQGIERIREVFLYLQQAGLIRFD